MPFSEKNSVVFSLKPEALLQSVTWPSGPAPSLLCPAKPDPDDIGTATIHAHDPDFCIHVHTNSISLRCTATTEPVQLGCTVPRTVAVGSKEISRLRRLQLTLKPERWQLALESESGSDLWLRLSVKVPVGA